MNKNRRRVRTYKDDEEMVVFELLEGRKVRPVETYGYGTCHDLWYRIQHHKKDLKSVLMLPRHIVKGRIASWGKAPEHRIGEVDRKDRRW